MKKYEGVEIYSTLPYPEHQIEPTTVPSANKSLEQLDWKLSRHQGQSGGRDKEKIDLPNENRTLVVQPVASSTP
jgi:hypothetical protein